MPIGIGSGLFAVVLPLDEINLATNASFEFGTSGVVAIQSATLGSSSGFQRYGAWSLSVTPNSNGTSGAMLGTFTTGNGTAYSVGAWVLGANGVAMRMGIGDNAGLNLTSGTTTFTGGGTWQWYSCGTVEAAQGTRSVVVQKTSGASVAPFYVDGVRISPWADGTLRTTTYFDGDTGGTWQGAQQASISVRTGQDRSGGSIVALVDLGLQVDQMLGVGMPPIENSSQSYAITDGAEFQRQRAASRSFTLTAQPIVGTSLADFHVTRRTLIDAFKPDLVTPQQPVRFLYYGGQGTVQVDGYYDKGLELGNMDGPIAESAAISFNAYDPYWYSPTQQGTTLAPRVSLGSTNFIVKRANTGAWGTLGANGTTIQETTSPALAAIYDLQMNAAGTMFLGGFWGTLAGTVVGQIGMYYPQLNTFGTLAGGTVGPAGGEVDSIAIAPFGSVYLGGVFGSVGGTVAHRVAVWNGAFGTLTGGTIDNANPVNKLLFSPTGTLFIGGGFLNAGGTAGARRLVQWANGSFGSIGPGTVDSAVNALAWSLDSSLYAGGNFGVANGTAVGSVARWNNAWGSLSSGASGGPVRDLVTKPDGRIAAVGNFTTMGGVTANGIAETNSIAWKPNGTGVSGGGAAVRTVFARQDNSLIIAGDFTSAGGNPLADPIAVWNGASYTSIGIDLPGVPIIYTVLETPDNTLYMAGSFTGTAQSATLCTAVNSGRAIAYPTFRFRNLSSGTARLYYLVNYTINAGVYFNLSLLSGEIATLTLAPGRRSFTSSFRGNILGNILPGSNLSSFNLLTGTNNLSFFADNDSLESAFTWTPRAWSIDGGTVT